jgi:hypothetical protein
MHRNRNEESVRSTAGTRASAAIIAIAPLAMLAAFVYHPHITFLPDADAVAHAVHADTLRWAIAHWGLGIASALMAAAWVAIREHLRDAGENRWSVIALPFLVFGAAVYAILPGMEFTVLAVTKTGGDVVAAQKAIGSWFVPTMMIAGITNAVGLVFLARAIMRSSVLAEGPKGLVVAALYTMAVSRLVPIGPVQFYVQGLAAVVALWPIALDVSRQLWRPSAGRTLVDDHAHATFG